MWRITFPPDGASELIYPHSGRYFVGAYENDLSHRATLRIEGGIMGNLGAATGSDSDWDYTKSPGLWYYGEFKTTGTSNFLKVDWKKPTSENSEFFFGYSYRHNGYHMTDGRYFIENYVQDNPPNILSSLNSTYDITYQGPHVGVTAKSKVSSALTVVGSLSYSPFAAVQGHGWWNLRDLDFIHTGPGQIWDGDIGLRFAPGNLNNAAITVGYRYQYMSLLRGTENTSSAVVWDKATSIQQGYYVSGQIRF